MSMLNGMHWRHHIALDVGTAATRIACGLTSLIEKPSRIGSRNALRDGVVVDGEAVSQILKPLLERTRLLGIFKSCVLACAPSDAKEEERQLLIDSIMKAGAASVSVIPEPLAAAIGAGIDVSSQYAQMVIDIGEGVTDCAVIRSSKIYATCAIRGGCKQMREKIVTVARKSGDTHITDSLADALMRTCGFRHSIAGSVETAAILQQVLEDIVDTVGSFLKSLPDDLGCEIIDSGICLSGGGALIPGAREYFEQKTGISITTAHIPQAAVVEGARAILPVTLSLNQWR